uniref:L-serine deaminase n=1 Tax=Astyanax mexicanus TaxID=7994 RepID=A0A8B9HNQ9_ASTMX
MENTTADSITLQVLKEAMVNHIALKYIILYVYFSLYFSFISPTGSFKIRGVANQFARKAKGGHFVTMSAGNYGKSFAFASKHYGTKGKVVMPETAPISRSLLIQVRTQSDYRIMSGMSGWVPHRQKPSARYLTIYCSLGFEVLEVVPNPDIVVVCCGGGGLLAGVAAAIKLSGCDETKIYGVEPEGGKEFNYFLSKNLIFFKNGNKKNIIVLVTDEEIKSAVSTLYRAGLVVEPSGSAAFAAVINGRIPNITGKTVVVILSGGNIGKDELTNFPV